MVGNFYGAVQSGSAAVPIDLAFTDAQSLTASGTSLTGTLNIGTASADRLVVVVLSSRRDASHNISAASIGGVAATVSPNTANITGNLFFLWARVPSGTTASLSVTFTQSGEVCRANVYTIKNQVSDTPVQNSGLITTAGTSRSVTTTIPARSVVIAADSCVNNALTTSWSGTMGVVQDAQGQWNSGGAYTNLSTASLKNNGGSLGSVTATDTYSGATTTPKFCLLVWQ